MFWFWTGYLATSVATQFSIVTLGTAIRAFLQVGRLTAGPVLKFAARRAVVWSRTRITQRAGTRIWSAKQSPSVPAKLCLVTEDLEFMVITMARKEWPVRLAFINTDGTLIIKACMLSRSDAGVLSWSEEIVLKDQIAPRTPVIDSVMCPIESGLFILAGSTAHLVSLIHSNGRSKSSRGTAKKISKKNAEVFVARKQSSSSDYHSHSVIAHVGHDTVAAIGYESENLEIYRNRNNTWTVANEAAPTNVIHGSLAMIGDTLFLVGGRQVEDGIVSGKVCRLDLPPDSLPLAMRLPELRCSTWTTCKDMPTRREKFAAMAVRGKLVVIGGSDSQGTPLETVETYDPGANEWSRGPRLNYARFSPSCIQVGNYIIIMNGYDASGKPVKCMESVHCRNLIAWSPPDYWCDDENASPTEEMAWMTLGDRDSELYARIYATSERFKVQSPISERGMKHRNLQGAIGLTSDSDGDWAFEALNYDDKDPIHWFLE